MLFSDKILDLIAIVCFFALEMSLFVYILKNK